MNTKITTRELTMMALMTAVMCVLAPLSIPLPGLVPISLGTLVIYFYPYFLGTRRAAICLFIYVALGAIGLPVFTGYTGGLPKLVGPTGGYIVGYFFIVLFHGSAIKRFPQSKLAHILGIVIGTACCYLIGTIWLGQLMGISFTKALAGGVIPFIPGDICKATVAVILAPVICARLQKAGLMLN